MRPIGTPGRPATLEAVFVLCAAAFPALAQPDVRVVAGDVSDSRFSGGYQTGGLSLKVKVRGDGMDGVTALRFHLTDVRDDLGTPLLPEKSDPPKFSDVRGDRVEESLWLRNPARDASSFSVSGRVEMFVPGRDPNAVVKVVKALANPNRPLASPGLKAANVRVTVLRQAASSVESVTLRGRTADFERIRSIRILRSDGTEIRIGSTGRISDSEETKMTLEASEPVPKNASLVFTILTAKARVSIPFELKDVPLP
jgi:hypothetical protein